MIENTENIGFAAAANQGAEAATGDVILFLNPDAVVTEGFREAIVLPLTDGRGWAAWMGLVTMDAGAASTPAAASSISPGISWAGGAATPIAAARPSRGEVAFASGACLAVRAARGSASAASRRTSSCTARTRTCRCGCAWRAAASASSPSARVDHEYEFAKGGGKWRLLERNRWATVVRTYPGALLALVAPALLATELALVAISVAGGWGRQKLLATSTCCAPCRGCCASGGRSRPGARSARGSSRAR